MKKKEKNRKRNKTFTNILLVAGFITGLILVMYPSIANYINERNATRVINEYTDALENVSDEDLDAMLAAAREYNARIPDREIVFKLSDVEKKEYRQLLSVDGNRTMGYIEIPSINVHLPIYHGTDEYTLQTAVGHVEWTSLPVGGPGTHCVVSGHRGLPNALLFTNLDDLVEGDVFMLRVLNEVLTYEVDQILTVLPSEINDLRIVENMDYCTLVTCTPYGVNTHRLLVRGHRIENTEEAAMVWIPAEAMQVQPIIAAAVVAVPTLLLIMVIVFISNSAKKRRNAAKELIRKEKKNIR